MTLTSSTSTLVSSLINFQNALQVTSNNIANVGTTGYSRRIANFAENVSQNINGMQFGSGAFISSVERIRDIYLDNEIRSLLTQVGYNQTLSQGMDQLAAFFPDIASPGAPGGLSNLINSFYS